MSPNIKLTSYKASFVSDDGCKGDNTNYTRDFGVHDLPEIDRDPEDDLEFLGNLMLVDSEGNFNKRYV